MAPQLSSRRLPAVLAAGLAWILVPTTAEETQQRSFFVVQKVKAIVVM